MRYCLVLILLFFAAPALADSCLPSDAACILPQVVDHIDPAAVKTVQDENLAIWTATSVVLLGDDKLRQQMLDKIQKIPDGAVPQQPYAPGTTPDREKAYAEMILLASLGRTPEVVKTIRGLQDKNEAFETGLEPQVRVMDRLAVIGKPDAAKSFLKDTRDIKLKSDGLRAEWKWPQGPPALLLIKEFLNEGKLQDAQDVAGMISEPGAFSKNVGPDAVQALFTRYKAPKDAKAAPQTVPPAPTAKYEERNKILHHLKIGQDRIAQSVFEHDPRNRRIVLANIMQTFADSTTKPESYDDIFSFYMQGCQELYPKLNDSRYRCLLTLLNPAVAKKESAINREFDAKYPVLCTASVPGGSCK